MVGFKQKSWQYSVPHKSNWFEDVLKLSRFVANTNTDVPGRELADKLAKKSTLEKSSTYYNTSLSYLKRVTQAAKMQEWGDSWMRHPAKWKNYVGIFCTKPNNIFKSGNHQFSLTVTQLQTGHGYFRSCLYKIPTNPVDSPHCPCHYRGPQSPEHLLVRCPV
jgi:hypothetical protein